MAKRQRLASDADADVLIVACSPAPAPPASAHPEAEAIRQSAQLCGARVEVRTACTAAELRDLLTELQPRVLVFIGHAHEGSSAAASSS
jgi:hypothetical protein